MSDDQEPLAAPPALSHATPSDVGGARQPGAPRTPQGWHRWHLALVVTVAAVLIGGSSVAMALFRAPRHPAPPRAMAPVASATAAQLAAGHWSLIPASPIPPRADALMVWTGNELLVWGGQSERPEILHNDGAAYNPTTGRWRKLASSPLSPRALAVAVWDGREMLVWGGSTTTTAPLHTVSDGAAYDPSTDQWRTLPASPLAPRAGALAAWTGTAMVIVGGSSYVPQFTTHSDSAAYDPSVDAWSAVSAIPVPGGRPSLMYTSAVQISDGRLLAFEVWTTCVPDCPNGGSYGTDTFSFDEATGSWSVVPVTADALNGVYQAVWTGHAVFAKGGNWCGGCSGGGPPGPPQLSALFDPARDTWTPVSGDPLAPGYPTSVWTGSALFSLGPSGEATAYDPALGPRGWLTVPSAPPGCGAAFTSMVWTGHQVLMVMACDDSSAAASTHGMAFRVPTSIPSAPR